MTAFATALAAIVMLGEPIRSYHVIGGGLVLAGVIAAQLLKRPLGRRVAVELPE